MSLKLGGSKSSSSSSSNSNSTTNSNTSGAFNTTSTPTVPEWASSLTQGVAGRVGDLTHLDPHSLVAGVNPLQSRAAAGATNLSGSPWNFDGAADLTRGAANTSWLDSYLHGSAVQAKAAQAGPAPTVDGSRAAPFVDSYMNPYLNDVVSSTAADFDQQAGQTRAQQDLALAGSGAFGGSGAALTKSMTEGELARARASSLGALRSQGYQTALGAAQGDAERSQQAAALNAQLAYQADQANAERQQQVNTLNPQLALQDRAQRAGLSFQGQQQQLEAANQLAGLSSAYDANQRANIGVQDQVGQNLRSVDQQQLQAPVTSTQQIVAMLSGLPIQLFTGQTQSGTQTGSSSGNTASSSSGTQQGKSSSWGASASVAGPMGGGWKFGS